MSRRFDARKDVVTTSLEVLAAEEEVERQARALKAAKERHGWAVINHRAATALMRRMETGK